MKVLLITPNLQLDGGVSAYWNSLLLIMQKYNDIEISTLEIGGNKRNIFGFIIDQLTLYRKLKIRYDIVVINPSLTFKSFVRDGLFARQCVKKQIPFFMFFHGWDIDFQKQIDKKYKKLFIYSFGYAQKIFVLSKTFEDKIYEWGYQGNIIVETTNIDSLLLKGFSITRKSQKIKDNKIIKILFLARLLREKGIFELIESFKILSKKFNNLELLIAGDGKSYDEIQDAIDGISNIKLLGHVKGKQKIKLFTQSHIYCLPSYSEGLPTSVLEAMAFGLPIITTQVGGLKEFFHNKKMGYFVRIKDSKDLADKIELLLLDRDSIRVIGEYNHNYAYKNLLNTVVGKRMYEQIKSTII